MTTNWETIKNNHWSKKKKKKFLRDEREKMCRILVLSLVVAVGCFPGGSVPDDPRKPGRNHSSRMALRNQQG